MPQETLAADSFAPDILDFLVALQRHDVRYLIVGGEAVIYYGHARLTGDIDFFYEPSEANATRLFAALLEFWDGEVPGIQTARELEEPGMVVQFGRPPYRIDLLSSIDAVSFAEAWEGRRTVQIRREEEGSISAHYIGLPELIRNKETSGRSKDLEDLGFLRRER